MLRAKFSDNMAISGKGESIYANRFYKHVKLKDVTILSTRENSVYLEEGSDVHVENVQVNNYLVW